MQYLQYFGRRHPLALFPRFRHAEITEKELLFRRILLKFAVLRLIETTIKNAKKAGIPVGMCGEAAADTRLIPLLCKWGLDEFSVTPSSILHTRKSICECE